MIMVLELCCSTVNISVKSDGCVVWKGQPLAIKIPKRLTWIRLLTNIWIHGKNFGNSKVFALEMGPELDSGRIVGAWTSHHETYPLVDKAVNLEVTMVKSFDYQHVGGGLRNSITGSGANMLIKQNFYLGGCLIRDPIRGRH